MIKLLEEAFGLLKRLDDSMGSKAISRKNYTIILEQLSELRDDLDYVSKKMHEIMVHEESSKEQFIAMTARLHVFLVNVLTHIENIYQQLALIAHKCPKL